jgi:hypothetical protein
MTMVALGLSLGVLTAGCSGSQPMPAASPAVSVAEVVSADSAVDAILKTSCFQCHSSQGSAPWYAAVSPTYLAANSARGVLNFSEWQGYDADKKAAELKTIQQSVGAGSMPPSDYTALDHAARLSEDKKQVLLKWAAQPAH